MSAKKRPIPPERLRVERDRVNLMMKDRAHFGSQYHILLGMYWALEWVRGQNSTPSHIVRSMSDAETAHLLAEQHEQLLVQIDALMLKRGEQLFGGNADVEKGGA